MKLKVADIIVEFEPRYDIMKSRVNQYIYNGEKDAEITINLSEKFFLDRQKENPHLSLSEVEALFSATYFYTEIVRFGGLMLHASCVQYENYAYLFSANSGTGKSTHTHLWMKYLPGARILNDDKPAIRYYNGQFYAFGTPWSGKTDESANAGAPIGGICFISRGENKITKISGAAAIGLFMEQTARTRDKAVMDRVMTMLNRVLSEVPVYKLSCDMSEEAVMTSYKGMTDTR
jgi:hypothetical protein